MNKCQDKKLCMHENAAQLHDEDMPEENLTWHLDQHAGEDSPRPQPVRHAFFNMFSANLPLVIFCACSVQMDESPTNFDTRSAQMDDCCASPGV